MPDPPDPTPDADLVAMFTEVLDAHASGSWYRAGDGTERRCQCGERIDDIGTHQAEQLAARLEQVGVIGPRCRASGANATLWRSWIPDDSISVFAIREEQST